MGRLALAAYLVVGVLLAVAAGQLAPRDYPLSLIATAAAATIASVVAVWAARRQRRREERRLLMLLAASLGLWASGDVGAAVWAQVASGPPPVFAFDVPWVAARAVFFSTVVLMVLRRAPGQMRSSVLDMLIVTGALATAQVVLLYLPLLREPQVPTSIIVLITAYDVGDLLMAATLVLLLMSPGRRGPSTYLLLGFLVVIVTNAAVIPWLPEGVYPILPVVGEVFVADVPLAYTFVAAAIAHPASADLMRPVESVRRTVHPARLVFLGLSLLVGPVIALGRDATSATERVILLVASTAVVSLVLVRVSAALRAQERAEMTLHHQASHDLLTGLVNRGRFWGALEEALRHHPRSVVMYLDLDDFKPVNDRHGHEVGDAVLVATAARLRGAVRSHDVVARLGGDEFAILCPGTASSPEVEALADRLVQVVREPIPHGDVTVQVGVSIGLAEAVRQDGDGDLPRVLRKADEAMYAAKRQGRGRWVLVG